MFVVTVPPIWLWFKLSRSPRKHGPSVSCFKRTRIVRQSPFVLFGTSSLSTQLRRHEWKWWHSITPSSQMGIHQYCSTFTTMGSGLQNFQQTQTNGSRCITKPKNLENDIEILWAGRKKYEGRIWQWQILDWPYSSTFPKKKTHTTQPNRMIPN